MTMLPTVVAMCDRRDCPALAQHVVLVHDQDLYFCGHHAAEMQGSFAAVAAKQMPLADGRDPGQAVVLAWREEAVAERVPADEW